MEEESEKFEQHHKKTQIHTTKAKKNRFDENMRHTDHVGSIFEWQEKYECAGRNAMKDFGNDILSAGIQRYQQVSTINKAK